MTDAIYPQVRIVPARLLYPETVQKLINLLYEIDGIRRMLLNGPSVPATVPYGPAKGLENSHTMRQRIQVGEKEIQLQVQVGTILLELENRDIIPAIKAACDETFTNFSYQFQEGRFMKTEPSLVDYAKFGPDADKNVIGMADPKSRQGPVILQGIK
jgi:methyl-coenzyme M reductase subunit D